MDVLGSILKTMDKPPSRSVNGKTLQKPGKAEEEKIPLKLTEEEITFTARITQRLVSHFALPVNTELKFEPMDYPQRNIIHKVAQSLEHVSYDFGVGKKKRYVMVYRQTHQPDYNDRYIRRYRQPYSELEKKLLAAKGKPVPKIEPIPKVKPMKESLARVNAGTSGSLKTPVLKVKPVPKVKPVLKEASQEKRKRRKPLTVDTFVPKHDYREKYIHLLAVKPVVSNREIRQVLKCLDQLQDILKSQSGKDAVKDLMTTKEEPTNQKGPTRQG